MGRLLRRVTQTITRNTTAGTYNAAGEWVRGTTTTLNVECNLQPYRRGTEQMTLPEGVRSEDVLIMYTKTPIRAVDQFDKTLADETTIKNREYVALMVEDWNLNNLKLDHYKVYWVRKDLATNGTL